MTAAKKNQSGMIIEKKNGENSRQVVNRFIRHLKQSGILQQARETMYRKRPLSRKLKIRKALRREELRRYYQKLEKLGKI
jgi:ribosomal protein S21